MRPLRASREVVTVCLCWRRHRLVHRSHNRARGVELRGPYTLVAHVRWIHEHMMGRVLLLVRWHHRRAVLGEAMVRIVARVVDHARARHRMMHRMPVLLRMWILLLTGRGVTLVALALALLS